MWGKQPVTLGEYDVNKKPLIPSIMAYLATLLIPLLPMVKPIIWKALRLVTTFIVIRLSTVGSWDTTVSNLKVDMEPNQFDLMADGNCSIAEKIPFRFCFLTQLICYCHQRPHLRIAHFSAAQFKLENFELDWTDKVFKGGRDQCSKNKMLWLSK